MLRNKRLASNLLQRDVAVVLNIKPSDYSKMERGIYPTSQLTRWILACLYRCTAAELTETAMPNVVKKTRIGEWFENSRKRQNIALEELAVKADLDLSLLEKLITGESIPVNHVVRKVITALFPDNLTQ